MTSTEFDSARNYTSGFAMQQRPAGRTLWSAAQGQSKMVPRLPLKVYCGGESCFINCCGVFQPHLNDTQKGSYHVAIATRSTLTCTAGRAP